MTMRAFLRALRNLLWGNPVEEPGRQLRVLSTAVADHRMTMEPSERSTSMNMAYEKLMQHFDEREIRYLADGEGQRVYADFTGEAGAYRIVAVVDVEAEVFHVFGCPSVRIPEGARPAIAETVARANHKLMVGKFEMDYDAGEWYFQASGVDRRRPGGPRHRSADGRDHDHARHLPAGRAVGHLRQRTAG